MIQLPGYLLLSMGLLCTFSCNQYKATSDEFYDVDSLLTSQINLLIRDSASICKVIRLGSKIDTVTIKPRTVAKWKSELDVYYNVDVINRFHASNTYNLEDNLRDSRSNLKIRSIAVKDSLDESIKKDLRVHYLRVFYEGQPQHIRRMEARYSETNAMFKHDQYLTLMFEDIYQEPRLNGYKVEGGQKVMMGDTLDYSIEARILYLRDSDGKEKAK